jgi:prophage regulatory protein
MQVLRRPAVEQRTGLSRASIYAYMNAGTFPRPLRIGTKAVAWNEADIDAWLASRPLAA